MARQRPQSAKPDVYAQCSQTLHRVGFGVICSIFVIGMQLLKNLEPYIQQGLQVVQQLKAEEIQNEEGLEAQIYNYQYAILSAAAVTARHVDCTSSRMLSGAG